VSEPRFYRWRDQFGGMKADELKRLKELETESARLKRLVADQALNIAALNEVSKGRMKVSRGCGCAGGPRVTLPVGDCLFVGGDLAFGDAVLFAVERVAVAAGGAEGVSGFELDRAEP
jgi:putative transposase